MDIHFYKNLLDALDDLNLRLPNHGLDVSHLQSQIEETMLTFEDGKKAA